MDLRNNPTGGLLLLRFKGRSPSASIADSTITQNESLTGGGVAVASGKLTIKRTLIGFNTANRGAGIDIFKTGAMRPVVKLDRFGRRQ